MCDRAPGNNMENNQIGLEPDISRQPGIEDLTPEKHGPVIMYPGTEKIVPALTTGEPWTCSCGTRNPGKFCTECGAALPVEAPIETTAFEETSKQPFEQPAPQQQMPFQQPYEQQTQQTFHQEIHKSFYLNYYHYLL